MSCGCVVCRFLYVYTLFFFYFFFIIIIFKCKIQCVKMDVHLLYAETRTWQSNGLWIKIYERAAQNEYIKKKTKYKRSAYLRTNKMRPPCNSIFQLLNTSSFFPSSSSSFFSCYFVRVPYIHFKDMHRGRCCLGTIKTDAFDSVAKISTKILF